MEVKLTRAFIAIRFPDEVIKEIARAQELLSKQLFTGKLTELENLHLTLKFLGEIDDEVLEKVKFALSQISFSCFEAKLGQIGIFHYQGKPQLVWVKMLGKEVYELQKKLDEALTPLGFIKEERFMGHLTIARIRYVSDKKGFEEHAKNVKVKDIPFPVLSFSLFRSELLRQGPVYTELANYVLLNTT